MGLKSLVCVAAVWVGSGCAAASQAPAAPVQSPEVGALRRENAGLRRKLAALEDRVVRLEQDRSGTSGHNFDLDRPLPVVQLRPPAAVRPDAPEPPQPQRRSSRARTLGAMPNSGEPDVDWDDQDAIIADETQPAAVAQSYRLVGTRLVELTKTQGPKHPDSPAQDSPGKAILTEYETAMALYKAGEVKGAERAFELFARAHPDHDYADNALYWKGEAAYDQEHYADALAAFTEVVERYGGGNKAPDALLKIGLCYQNLGDTANALDVLTQLVAAYPGERASDIARARLPELGM